jgi:hypothetical protein
MKALKIVGLGIVTWGLSLLWPQINQLLAPPIVVGVILGLSVGACAYVMIQRLDHDHNDSGTSHDHTSRPMPAIATR